MRRRTADLILTSLGALLTLVLLVAGGLLIWGYTFANNNVHDQLASQKIFFPEKGSPQLAPPEIGRHLNKYAGQQVTTGAQAKAFADHFIAEHLKTIGGGKTYSELSAQSQANPNDKHLQDQVDTVFRGQTLRGLLLNAYAFWKLGQIAKWAAIAAFSAAALMLALTLLGLRHLRQVPPDQPILGGRPL